MSITALGSTNLLATAAQGKLQKGVNNLQQITERNVNLHQTLAKDTF